MCVLSVAGVGVWRCECVADVGVWRACGGFGCVLSVWRL